MNAINIILDYKKRFETKYTAVPYRSGFDKDLLQHYFMEQGYAVCFTTFSEIDFRDEKLKGKVFLYSSSEDQDGFYKTYIEDMVLGLKLAGAIVVPDYIYLKAHNNKLFMEILRDTMGHESVKNIKSRYFGTLEDLQRSEDALNNLNCVIKPAMGAMSKGVSRGASFHEIYDHSKTISRAPFHVGEIKDWLRKFKHKGYIVDSKYRKKFIVQNMVEGLDGDWKILIYGDKYYPLNRKNRENDFRASGGGRLSYVKELPEGLLSFAKTVYESFNVPNLSIDVAFDGSGYYLIEFQALYFGTYTIEKSEFYFMRRDNEWGICEERSILEREYARSISAFVSKLPLE
ncbi:hypothetical protein SAMN05216323_100146 [Williamwhitmania taraxaci]|uniref:ATP-grasp domain-containing protein n=2 Tax=Williamwhitmania taraxaci TaxID=1640674 RepID=A0A1G6GGX0_9BACT|nr:hypothetical protein SAMN05216323_100146 [Williamwhitmania taraxaci]